MVESKKRGEKEMNYFIVFFIKVILAGAASSIGTILGGKSLGYLVMGILIVLLSIDLYINSEKEAKK